MPLQVPTGIQFQVPPPAPPPEEPGFAANLVTIPQDSTVWCWAACVETVLVAEGVLDKQQCRIAEIAFQQTCCPRLTHPECVKTLAPAQVELLWRDPEIGHPDVTFRCGHLPRTQFDTLLALQRPIEVWLESDTMTEILWAVPDTSCS